MAELYVTLRTRSITKGPGLDELREGFTDSEALFPTSLRLGLPAARNAKKSDRRCTGRRCRPKASPGGAGTPAGSTGDLRGDLGGLGRD